MKLVGEAEVGVIAGGLFVGAALGFVDGAGRVAAAVDAEFRAGGEGGVGCCVN